MQSGRASRGEHRQCPNVARYGTRQFVESAMAPNNRFQQARTASGANIVVGLWLVVSPWVFAYGYADEMSTWNVTVNSVIVGALVAVFAFMRNRAPARGAGLSWINVALGVWMAATPFAYTYVTDPARMNSFIVGIVIAALALWSGSATTSARRHAHA
jgi:hypothetical protein